ncbi:MAG: hypothetical protein ACP6IP_09460 [Candidatus Njordarchaeia archaeon]
MKKLKTIFIALILVMSVAYAAQPARVQAVTGTDLALNHKYVWQLDKIDLTTVSLLKNLDKDPLNVTDDILNQLEGAKFEIAVGNYDNVEDELYIVPIVIIQQDFQITSSILEQLGVPSNYSSDLAFTIPKGSGLVFLYEIFMNAGPVYIMNTMSKGSVKIGLMNGPSTPTSMVVSIPYDYGDASPPLPFVPADELSDYGDDWENMTAPDGITATYTESNGKATFSASGSNTTSESHDNYSFEGSYQVTKFEIVYDLDTGVLQSIEAKVHFTENETWYDEWNGKWKSRYQDVQMEIKLTYKGNSEIEIGLVDGQNIGYKVTEFYMSDDLLGTVNRTLMEMTNHTLTPENVTFINNVMSAFAWKFTYRQTNPYYNSGLDLYYDLNVSNSALNESETTPTVFNVYQLGSPYVTPDWEVQYATFQFQSHAYLKLLPKYYKFMIENEEPGAYLNYDTAYKILESGDGNWISMVTNASFNIGYNETNPAEGSIMFDATLNLDSWMTYSSDGILSQIGMIVSFSAKNDTDGDNSLTDETAFTGTLKIVVNRVQNQGNNPTQEPDYDQPVNVPTPSQSWQDKTPVTAQPSQGAGGALGGLLGGEIYGVPIVYIGGGIAFIVIVGALLFAVRRR